MKVKSFITTLLILIFILPSTVFAAGAVDTERNATLTLTYPVADIEFRLYKVADIEKTGEYTLNPVFEQYNVTFSQSDNDEWRNLAQTLDGYVERDKIEADAKGITDANGVVNLDLSTGMYLVTWTRHKSSSYTYTPEPYIISLPTLKDNDWVYEVTSVPKYDRTKRTNGGGSSTINKRVHKAWSGDTESERPKSISVQLLRDGEVYDTATLDSANGWSKQWDYLDSSHTWKIVEEAVPEGYTVSSSTQGITTVLTNSAKPTDEEEPPVKPPDEEPKTPNEDGGKTPTTDNSKTPTTDNKTTTTTPGTSTKTTSTGTTLPQTGQDWTFIIVLALLGMVTFALGCSLDPKRKND